MRVVMDMRLVLVLSPRVLPRVLVSTVGVVRPRVVVIVSMDRAQMFEFLSRSAPRVVGHMCVGMIMEQSFVTVALKTLNHRTYTSSLSGSASAISERSSQGTLNHGDSYVELRTSCAVARSDVSAAGP